MDIKMCDIQQQYKYMQGDIDDVMQEVAASGAYVGGSYVDAFEEKMQEYLGVKYAIGCANGTDALSIAMMAMDIKPGDEIITTPFTFVATAETIALIGAVPVYVDIDPQTYNMDPAKIEEKITDKTKAIIPVHIWGQACDMDAINTIAKKHKLLVLEDNAQGIGAEYNEQKLGTLSDIATISFYPAKNLGAMGDGGMIVTNNKKLAEKARMICNHGSKTRYYHECLGVNSRLDAIQAAILSIKLDYLDKENFARLKISQLYNYMMNHPEIKTPYYADYGTPNIHQYGICVNNRDALREYLSKKKIPTAIHYPIPLHLQPAFKTDRYHEGDFPIAEEISKSVLNLPIHPYLTEKDILYISKCVLDFINNETESA